MLSFKSVIHDFSGTPLLMLEKKKIGCFSHIPAHRYLSSKSPKKFINCCIEADEESELKGALSGLSLLC